MNSLPLSSVVISYANLQGKPLLTRPVELAPTQVGLSVDKAGNSLCKGFERNTRTRSNLSISLPPGNRAKPKTNSNDFLHLGRICFRKRSRQFADKVFRRILLMLALGLFFLSHTCFFT